MHLSRSLVIHPLAETTLAILRVLDAVNRVGADRAPDLPFCHVDPALCGLEDGVGGIKEEPW